MPWDLCDLTYEVENFEVCSGEESVMFRRLLLSPFLIDLPASRVLLVLSANFFTWTCRKNINVLFLEVN